MISSEPLIPNTIEDYLFALPDSHLMPEPGSAFLPGVPAARLRPQIIQQPED